MDLIPSLLTLSDVMSTGWHAAVSAGVQQGMTVAVVGDGAVGLCGVIAASQLGADRVIAMSRHATRQKLAEEFGATDIVTERGDDGVARIKELTDDVGADAVLECVGTGESMLQALRSVRPGGVVGCVGVPHGVELPARRDVLRERGPARRTSPRPAVPPRTPGNVSGSGASTPARFSTCELPLEQVADAYRAMDQREAIKVLLHP